MAMSPIISIKEARQILGKDAEGLGDEEIINIINTLDEIAKFALEDAKKRVRLERTELLQLASFLYSRYIVDKTRKLS